MEDFGLFYNSPQAKPFFRIIYFYVLIQIFEDHYLKVLQEYPQVKKWPSIAQARILELLHDKDNYLNTIAAYRNLIKVYPQFTGLAAEAQSAIGKIYFNHGDINQSIKEYNLLLEQHPEQIDFCLKAYTQLGQVYLEIKNFEKAIDIFQEGIVRYNSKPHIKNLIISHVVIQH